MKRTKKERNSRGSSDKRQLNPDGSDYQVKPITRINTAARPPMERIPIDFLTSFVSPFRSVAEFQESKGIWSQAVSTSIRRSFGSRPREGVLALVDLSFFFDKHRQIVNIHRCHPVFRCTQTILFPTEVELEAMVLDPVFIYRL